MKKFWSFVSPGAWVTVVVGVIVGGQYIGKVARHPKPLDAIAKESGNLNFMLENERPQISHDGSRILFCHSTENGVDVFVADTATGETGAHGVTRPTKKLLFEEMEIHFGMGPHGVLALFPWPSRAAHGQAPPQIFPISENRQVNERRENPTTSCSERAP